MKFSRLVAVSLIGVPICAHAITFNFSSSLGGDLYSAQAVFTYNAGVLDVVFRNLGSTADTNQQSLTGLFWDMNGYSLPSHYLGTIDPNGSNLLYGSGSFSMSDLGKHWAYKNDVAAVGHTFDAGVSAAGLGLFSPSDAFVSGQTGSAINGPDWGLVNGATFGSTGFDNQAPYVNNSVHMTFYIGTGFTESMISRVRFQWGTSQTEPWGEGGGHSFFTPTPEPATMGFAAIAVSAALARRRRAAKKSV